MEVVLSKSELIDNYSVFVFDLDNTLYNEKDYPKSVVRSN